MTKPLPAAAERYVRQQYRLGDSAHLLALLCGVGPMAIRDLLQRHGAHRCAPGTPAAGCV